MWRARSSDSSDASRDGDRALLRVRNDEDGLLRPVPLLIGGVLYAVFIAVLLYHVLALDVTAAAAH